VASDFWPHGAVAKAYGVFDAERGAPVRGTFLIDRQGIVVWTLVNDRDTRRDELVSGPLGASAR
jgi:alkyl hydroperoxide reductase subunit AhpC